MIPLISSVLDMLVNTGNLFKPARSALAKMFSLRLIKKCTILPHENLPFKAALISKIDESITHVWVMQNWLKDVKNLERLEGCFEKIRLQHLDVKIRVLLARPGSSIASLRSKDLRDNEGDFVSDLVIENLKELREMAERYDLQLEIRLFSNIPLFCGYITNRFSIIGFYGLKRVASDNLNLYAEKSQSHVCFQTWSENQYRMMWEAYGETDVAYRRYIDEGNQKTIDNIDQF